MLVFETGLLTHPRYIINFPTKRHWRGNSRIEDIETGLFELLDEIKVRGIRSIAIPPLGSGLGGLDWSRVRPLIEHALESVPAVAATVYEPHITIDAETAAKNTTPPVMTASRAILILSIWRYLNAMLDPTITLLELHKLLYFLQLAGQQLRLQFVQAPYGPHAQNLRFVLTDINHYCVDIDMSGGDNPKAEVRLVPSATLDAECALASDAGALAHLDRVFDLIDGWKSPHGLELLAAVHWVSKVQGAVPVNDVVRMTYQWNSRKRGFSNRQIELAYSTLIEKGWITAETGTS